MAAAPEWVEIQEGEAAVLRLYGKDGNLDIFSTYFPTGSQACNGESLKQKREQLRERLADYVQGHSDVLSILAGGFNWVTDKEDRWTVRTSEWSGSKDSSEQTHWRKQLEDKCKLNELWQPHATHKDFGTSLVELITKTKGANYLTVSLASPTPPSSSSLPHHPR